MPNHRLLPLFPFATAFQPEGKFLHRSSAGQDVVVMQSRRSQARYSAWAQPMWICPGTRVTQDEISQELGRALARRRKELRLSLAQVARRCGVSLQQIHKYETGQNDMSAPMLFQLALCLDVPASYFFEALEERRQTAAISEP